MTLESVFMSLWLQSLEWCLYDCEDNPGEKAKCILSHLSMGVPRSWWESALQTGSVSESYIHILHDLRGELMETSALSELPEFGLLVALGFIDKHIKQEELRFGSVDSQFSIEEYISRAKIVLDKRNDLSILGKMIEEKAKCLV